MKELHLRNRQRDRKLATRFLRRVTVHLLEKQLGLASYELVVNLISASEMAEINHQFLQHEGSTDVITFDYLQGYEENLGSEPLDMAGEIYISVADAVEQSAEFGTRWTEELVRYIVHGALHLRGYDDLKPALRKVMKREEEKQLTVLRNTFDLEKISV